mmetsp:Transcript_26359/g.83469  ORF Transcript_26359/g.83469 Transcript_26359/m.83469 type:complete len:431 (-) Transcript_26359:104-1396(-)
MSLRPWPPRASAGCCAPHAALAACVVLLEAMVGVVTAEKQRPVCMMADALVDSVDAHLAEWDNQIDTGLNSTLNCSMFLEFTYLSRDRIRAQLEFIRGNFSADDEAFRSSGEQGVSTTWAMSYMSTAASLVSAHLHIHGVLGAARRDCLSEHLHLLFLMSLKRLKSLLQNQLRQLWVIFQGTGELFRQGAGRWLGELLELFEADIRTYESIMASWQPPEEEVEELPGAPEAQPARIGPPLPAYRPRDADGALSTVEVLRRDTFEEWNVRKPLLRALLRHALPRDGHIADLCAGSGLAATFLNDTGLVTAYAFDASPNIRLLSKGTVDFVQLHRAPLTLWRSFELVLCLSAARDFGADADSWAQMWQNVEAHATQGAILSCGDGEVRQQALGAAERHAPGLLYDVDLSELLDMATGNPREGVCAFRRHLAT